MSEESIRTADQAGLSGGLAWVVPAGGLLSAGALVLGIGLVA